MRARARLLPALAPLLMFAGLSLAQGTETPLNSPLSSSAISAVPLQRFEASYYLRLNGQELGRPLGESYNFFLVDSWPLQFYHEINLRWRLDPQQKIGLCLSGVQDLNEGVRSHFGYVIQPQVSVFHPMLTYSRSSAVDHELASLLLGVNLYLPTSDFAHSQGMLTTLGVDQDWMIKQPVSRLSVGLTNRVEHTFYGTPRPEQAAFSKRRWFLSAGHYANYQLSPRFKLGTSTSFDFEAKTGKGPTDGLRSLERHRLKLQLDFYPTYSGLRIGAYSEGLLTAPHRTLVGFDFTAQL